MYIITFLLRNVYEYKYTCPSQMGSNCSGCLVREDPFEDRYSTSVSHRNEYLTVATQISTFLVPAQSLFPKGHNVLGTSRNSIVA